MREPFLGALIALLPAKNEPRVGAATFRQVLLVVALHAPSRAVDTPTLASTEEAIIDTRYSALQTYGS